MTTDLRTYLFNAYGGFGDRRIKDLRRDEFFKIDDWRGDTAHDFCHILVSVPDPAKDACRLTLDNAPYNQEVENLLTDQGATFTRGPWGLTISIVLQTKQVPFVRKLAEAIRRVNGRHQNYPRENANWAWICGRTADSLGEFANHLADFRAQRRRPPPPPPPPPQPPPPPPPPPPVVPAANDEDLFILLGMD